MPGTINNEYGKVTISEDIIATVAGYAATENYGVVGMSAKTATDAILKLVGSEANKKRGVKVSFRRGGYRPVRHHGLRSFTARGGQKHDRQRSLSRSGDYRYQGSQREYTR